MNFILKSFCVCVLWGQSPCQTKNIKKGWDRLNEKAFACLSVAFGLLKRTPGTPAQHSTPIHMDSNSVNLLFLPKPVIGLRSNILLLVSVQIFTISSQCGRTPGLIQITSWCETCRKHVQRLLQDSDTKRMSLCWTLTKLKTMRASRWVCGNG